MQEKSKDYYGHAWQNVGVLKICLREGKASNVNAMLIENSHGLSMIVLEDRCLDIYSMKLNGFNIPFLSKAGIVHPSYYDSHQWEWYRSFGVGFLTTCGLTQAGEPCHFNGTDWGMHGPVSNIPAEDIVLLVDDDNIIIKGKIRQYKFQTEDLLLERTLTIAKNSNVVTIEDALTNEGWRAQPFMMLYHLNFGYPLINENALFGLPAVETEGLDDYSESVVDRLMEITPPNQEYVEQNFIHTLKEASENVSFYVADHFENPQVVLRIEYDATHLPMLTHWKHFKPSEYVMAIEPCNNHCKGVAWEKENGSLKWIEPGEKKTMRFKVELMSGFDETKR